MSSPKRKEVSTSNESTETVKTSSGVKRKRGINSMQRIVNLKNSGRKLVVEYNSKGKPYGKVATELVSYIGVLTRTMIPLSVESWPKVEKDLKNKIWESVEMAFVLAPKSKKMVLSSASNRWRQFKSDLTRKYIMPFKDDPEALENPPEEYDFIKKEHWLKFVNGRISEEFQKLHNEQKERRAKCQYTHRMSRKGYVGLEEELRKYMPEDELDGCLLWKKAREDRIGNISKALKNQLLMKQRKEHSKPSGHAKHSVHAEHSKHYEYSGHSEHAEHSEHSEHAEHSERAEHSEHSEHAEHSEHSEQAEHSEHSEHAEHSEHSEHAEHSEHSEPSEHAEHSEPSEHFDVGLSSKKNDAITTASVTAEHSARIEGVGGFVTPNVPRFQLLEREDVMDEVRKMIEQQGELFQAKITELEAKINGIFPTTPIPLPTPVSNPSEKASSSGKKKKVLADNEIDVEELALVGQRDAIKRRGKTAAKPQDLPKQNFTLPRSLKLLYRYAERAMLDGETIGVDMEEAIFGAVKTVCISQEDVTQFMEMKEISATCLMVYMRHLYDKLKQSNMVDMVGLTDPSSISVGVGDSDHKSRVLAARLQKGSADQILLVPYNSGYHWMLTIISKDKDICYFMDPLQRYFMDSLRRSMCEEEWKYVVNSAIRQFNTQTGRRVRKPPTWKVLTGPKQPSNMECGYYVMRYMKEIVEDENFLFTAKWDGKTLNAYTQAELDEVRREWADMVSDYM